MATVRRKGKSSKQRPLRTTRTAKIKVENSPNRDEEDSAMSNIKVENTATSDEEDNTMRGESPFSSMSLDVLAQVASETLEQEPRGSRTQSPRRLTRRCIQTRDHLTLSQISQLSARSLVDFFSELKANEMSRNYTFVCFLIPDKCQEEFSSFGNESRARLKMKSHLTQHLKELAIQEKKSGQMFSAEPITARKRRLEDSLPSKKKKKKLTAVKNKLNQDVYVLPKGQLISFSDIANANCSSDDSSPSKRKGKSSGGKADSENAQPDGLQDEEVKLPTKKKVGRPKAQAQKKKTSHQSNKEEQASVSNSRDISPDETERRIEENEQFIIDLLMRSQPHMDHCYTTIFGKKRWSELTPSDEESEGEEVIVDVGDTDSYYEESVSKPLPEPILLFRRIPGEEGTPMVCCEEIVGDKDVDREGDVEEIEDGHTGERPYPPMPKSALAKKGRIPVPEENVSFSEDEDGYVSPKRRKKSVPKEGSADWERKSALKCIRELKSRRKDDTSTPLICKICKTKTFTACATLMYHYRSHAGIKPFVCLICNTTFTRQHSLNYHMLIHNNQSRFTCKDCGRKFRHPSHFKEHLRRHTGETPFECADCPQKFKTRNTYKRHLKTRHGKLLTANGIHVLSREEFLLVRTKPYRRIGDSDEEEDIPDEDLLDSEEETEISVTDDNNLPVITQSAESLPLHITSEELSAPPMHGHVLPSGHFLVPVDLQFVMSS